MAFGLTQSADMERGSTQYFSASDSASLSITGSMSAECWVKLESNGIEQFLMGKQSGGSSRSWYFRVSSTDDLFVIVNQSADGSDRSITSGSSTLSTDTWYHVGFYYGTGDGRIDIELDGADDTGTVSDTSATAIADTDDDTELGSIQAGLNTFDGKMSLRS